MTPASISRAGRLPPAGNGSPRKPKKSNLKSIPTTTNQEENQLHLANVAEGPKTYSGNMRKRSKLVVYERDKQARSVPFAVKTDLQGHTLAEMRQAFEQLLNEQSVVPPRRRRGKDTVT